MHKAVQHVRLNVNTILLNFPFYPAENCRSYTDLLVTRALACGLNLAQRSMWKPPVRMILRGGIYNTRMRSENPKNPFLLLFNVLNSPFYLPLFLKSCSPRAVS